MRWRFRILAVAGCVLAPSAPLAAQAGLAGVVTEDTTGRPVASAEVWIEALGRMTRTDESGRYSMSGLAPGMRVVQVRLIGYHPVSRMVQLVAGETRQADITLQRAPAQLDTVVARTAARPLLPSFEEHRRAGLGRFLTRAELEKHEGRRLSDVLTQMPGVRIVTGGAGNRAWIAGGRGIASLQNQDAKCAGRTLEGGSTFDTAKICNCYALVYLDNVLLYRGEPNDIVPDVNRFQPEEIEAIEYYAGPAQTPARYSTMNSNCGVFVIHTRRTPGRSDEPPPPNPPRPP